MWRPVGSFFAWKGTSFPGTYEQDGIDIKDRSMKYEQIYLSVYNVLGIFFLTHGTCLHPLRLNVKAHLFRTSNDAKIFFEICSEQGAKYFRYLFETISVLWPLRVSTMILK